MNNLVIGGTRTYIRSLVAGPKLTIFSLMGNGDNPCKMCVWKGALTLGAIIILLLLCFNYSYCTLAKTKCH